MEVKIKKEDHKIRPPTFVLAGDPRQLPPVVRCQIARRLGLGTSLLERIVKYHEGLSSSNSGSDGSGPKGVIDQSGEKEEQSGYVNLGNIPRLFIELDSFLQSGYA